METKGNSGNVKLREKKTWKFWTEIIWTKTARNPIWCDVLILWTKHVPDVVAQVVISYCCKHIQHMLPFLIPFKVANAVVLHTKSKWCPFLPLLVSQTSALSTIWWHVLTRSMSQIYFALVQFGVMFNVATTFRTSQSRVWPKTAKNVGVGFESVGHCIAVLEVGVLL